MYKVEEVDRVAAKALFDLMLASSPITDEKGGRQLGRDMLQAFAKHRLQALGEVKPEQREALEAMTALDEELEAQHPGWMTGNTPHNTTESGS